MERFKCNGRVFEFGAGKTLAQNFYISDIVDEQVVVDLKPMLDLNLVEDVRKQLSNFMELKSIKKIFCIKDLEHYGINYFAPYDASKTHFHSESIDACISTNTLEHIPKAKIISIFKELYRVLKNEGIICARIDYSDHYAHTDKSISLLNFLKFNSNSWVKYNHDCHYQNRLRHYDYIEIFKKSGFLIVEEELIYSEINLPREIIEIFKNKDETWKATSAYIVLKKK